MKSIDCIYGLFSYIKTFVESFSYRQTTSTPGQFDMACGLEIGSSVNILTAMNLKYWGEWANAF